MVVCGRCFRSGDRTPGRRQRECARTERVPGRERDRHTDRNAGCCGSGRRWHGFDDARPGRRSHGPRRCGGCGEPAHFRASARPWWRRRRCPAPVAASGSTGRCSPRPAAGRAVRLRGGRASTGAVPCACLPSADARCDPWSLELLPRANASCEASGSSRLSGKRIAVAVPIPDSPPFCPMKDTAGTVLAVAGWLSLRVAARDALPHPVHVAVVTAAHGRLEAPMDRIGCFVAMGLWPKRCVAGTVRLDFSGWEPSGGVGGLPPHCRRIAALPLRAWGAVPSPRGGLPSVGMSPVAGGGIGV